MLLQGPPCLTWSKRQRYKMQFDATDSSLLHALNLLCATSPHTEADSGRMWRFVLFCICHFFAEKKANIKPNCICFFFWARFIERPGEISSIATSMSRIHPDDVTAAIVCQNTHFTLENCFKQTFKTWIHTAPDSLRLNRCRVTAQTI